MLPFIAIALIVIVHLARAQKRWEPLSTMQATSILRVIPVSTTDLFVAGFDEKAGSIIYHSTDEGLTWHQIESSTGNNLDFAVSKNGNFLCGIGTKIYCLELDETKTQQKSFYKFSVDAIASDIDAVEETGFALVGQFRSSQSNPLDVINGVAYNSQLDASYWNFYDIGLKIEDGYIARKGSFPTPTTWYVTSGSWPTENSSFATVTLTAKLSMIPGRDLLTYNFDLQSLSSDSNHHYNGAISKTMDGGKTWTKVFDSNKEFYFNEIDCINEYTCVTVGEGKKGTVVMKTSDAGETWEQVMRLTSSYSLHGVKMITTDDIWVCGGMLLYDNIKAERKTLRRRVEDNKDSISSINDDNNKKFIGLYYHSINRGKSWNLQTTEGYAYSMSFLSDSSSSSIGYAATIHREFSTISKIRDK